MSITPENSGDAWVPGDLMFDLWDCARKVVSASASAKAQSVASGVFAEWMKHQPNLKEDIELIFMERLETPNSEQLGQLQTVIQGKMCDGDERAFEVLVEGTSITPYGLLVISSAFRLSHPELVGKNAILVCDLEEDAEDLLNSQSTSLWSLRADFCTSMEEILSSGHEAPLLKAAALWELGSRLESRLKKVYSEVYTTMHGSKPLAGRKTAIESTAIQDMIHKFVQTRVLGRLVSDHELHTRGERTFEQHRNASEDITKGNNKVLAQIRLYRDYLCDFFGTEDGPLLTDPLIRPGKPGRPKSRAERLSKRLQKLQK